MRVTQNVEVRYIAKTILEFANLDSDNFGGENLVRIAEGQNTDSIIYSEVGKKLNAIYIADWKLFPTMMVHGNYIIYNSTPMRKGTSTALVKWMFLKLENC